METQEPTLRHGDESVDGWVEYLQGLLRVHGHDIEKTGRFDDATYHAVHAHQLASGCVADGVVGNQTWASLRHAAPEMAGTDHRETGTYVEDAAEARWIRDAETAHLDADAGEVLFLAVNVSSGPIDAAALEHAGAEVTGPNGESFSMALVPRNEHGRSTAPGARFFYVASNVLAAPPGRYEARCTLPHSLSGDTSVSHFEVPAH